MWILFFQLRISLGRLRRLRSRSGRRQHEFPARTIAPEQLIAARALCPPGTDKTAMDFRRLLPEIRWQSCLSPVPGTGSHAGGFSPLLGWAFRPRESMQKGGEALSPANS